MQSESAQSSRTQKFSQSNAVSHSADARTQPSEERTRGNSPECMYENSRIDGLRPLYKYMIKYMAVAVAVAVSGGGAVAVAVPVAGLTKRFVNHIQKDFLINTSCSLAC